MEIKPFLKELISASGLSGYEAPVRELIADTWQPMVDEMTVSRLGSLHALKRGFGDESRPRIMLAAHMDAIGLMVTAVVGGFLRFTKVGGVDARVLPGQLVTVHGRQDLPGVIVQPPSYLIPDDAKQSSLPMTYMLVDVGLLPRRLERLVRVGDLISFAQPPFELGEDTLAGHTLDNRASVAALTHCLHELQDLRHYWDVWIVATAQEEESLGGAFTSAFELRPDLAVAIDVTHGSGPGTPNHQSFPLGKGPVLGWGPNIHPMLHKSMKDMAERMEIPHQFEALPRHSGTDAYALQITAEGIPTMVVGIPLRYMHTPVEMVTIKDITRTGRMLAGFVASLRADFMDNLTWED